MLKGSDHYDRLVDEIQSRRRNGGKGKYNVESAPFQYNSAVYGYTPYTVTTSTSATYYPPLPPRPAPTERDWLRDQVEGVCRLGRL
jgi:hypothetical protein